MFDYRTYVWAVPVLLLTGVMALRVQAGLIASYSHENPLNRLQDDTGNGHTLTNQGATFIDSPAQPGFHYFELGDTVAQYTRTPAEYLSMPDAVYPKGDDGKGGSFTFTGLVNRTPSGAFQTVLSSSRFRLQLADNNGRRLHVGIQRPDGTWIQHYTPANQHVFDDDTWYFMALRYDGGLHVLHAFLQDALDTWNPVRLDLASGHIHNKFPDFTNVALGYNTSGYGGTDGLNGMIDGARFYTTALSDSELEAVFFQFAVPEPSTVVLMLLGLCGLFLRRNRRRG